jgi:hypothetical protein
MKFLSVTGYTRKDLIRNNKIREELNIFNVKNIIRNPDQIGNTTFCNWKADIFHRKF